jgi:hypothetical protein
MAINPPMASKAGPSYIGWSKRILRQITILMDLEVQHWIAEALDTAVHALELVGDRITRIGVQCTSRDGKRSQNESSGPSPAAKRAR